MTGMKPAGTRDASFKPLTPPAPTTDAQYLWQRLGLVVDYVVRVASGGGRSRLLGTSRIPAGWLDIT